MSLSFLRGRAFQTRVFPILIALALFMAFGPRVGAVHDAGLFELDGDAQDAATTGEDWDLICKAHAVPQVPAADATCTFNAGYTPPAGDTTATDSAHVDDGSLNGTIFQGGGSKDTHEISDWLWKDDAGGLPDKDNLLHAYAARYSVPKSSSCPAPASATNCAVIYFGSDRYDNSGDATQAFWFLQDEIKLGNQAGGGGFNFEGLHEDGDLLVISEFSNGGTTSTITVYKWQSGGLQFLAGGPDQKCGGSPTDPFCGIVNPSDGTIAPWTFLDKSGKDTFLNGEFYESGINLSSPQINLAGECFASFVAETRSSTSTTAQLKDFVLGPLGECTASMTTTPSTGAGGIVAPGTAVTDAAIVQGAGASPPPTPTGDVTFFLCAIASGTCTSGGTNIGTGPLGDSAPPAGEATATSPQVNTAGSPLGKGRYCFRAEWPGDDNYKVPLTHSGSGNSECFVVQDTTSITTAQDWLPNDSATITAGGGSVLNGSVVFSLYNTSLADCQAGGTTGRIYTQTVNLGTDTASGTTVSTSNTNVKVTETDTVWWRVVFNSTDSNVIGSTSNCTEQTALTITN